ncbi:hypothetical protein B296_00005972 [Ensete ventricosum]|uniref:Uncharacterized protein n=1 Tax=Ensete ventricosum TaxID=4639 RepID=A0A426ZD48_ENSVE|nr:hypothetical protein B296_00005972 [Ensete ventricosum]
MLAAVEGGMSGGFRQSCGESSEEELSVLPRHTKVVVTGNNRTKSVLVGLQGVVKKAVGLGGWHWLVILLSRATLNGFSTSCGKRVIFFRVRVGLGYNLIGFSRQEKSSVDFVVQWMGYLDNAVHRRVSLGVLTNGIEVKLQRNALSVIEAPTGHEEDDDLEVHNLQWSGSYMGKHQFGVPKNTVCS